MEVYLVKRRLSVHSVFTALHNTLVTLSSHENSSNSIIYHHLGVVIIESKSKLTDEGEQRSHVRQRCRC